METNETVLSVNHSIGVSRTVEDTEKYLEENVKIMVRKILDCIRKDDQLMIECQYGMTVKLTVTPNSWTFIPENEDVKTTVTYIK